MDRQVYFDELVDSVRGGVMIPKPEFVKEHLKLLDILRSGSRSERLTEAKDQAKELFKVLKGLKKKK
jgi:hypothetical protein